MDILVTGAAGFIGSHLVEYHLSKGDQVHAVDTMPLALAKNILPFQTHANFHFTQADLVTCDHLPEIIKSAERIYHMAAVVGVYKVLAQPLNVLMANILGTERLLHAASSLAVKPRILLASSSEVYGPNPDKQLSEETNLVIEAKARNPWHYAVSKLADESFGLAYHHEFKLPVTLIRFFNTIGPRQVGDYGMVIPRLIQQAVNHEPITVFSDGLQTRSFCDVRDTVVILVKKLAHSSSDIHYVPYDTAYATGVY